MTPVPQPRLSKYPWDEWTDGGQYVIYKGEDYTISTHNMQISLHGRARKHGLKVTSRAIIDRSRDAHGYLNEREGLTFMFTKNE